MNSFDSYVYLVPLMGLIGLMYTIWKYAWVSKQDAGTDRMKEISTYIAEGAMAFLKAEWKVLTYFGIVVALLLAYMGASNKESHWSIAIAFLIGAFFSAFAGFIGMKAATKANVRTAHAARTSLSKALKVSFTGGSVMGMGVAGLAVLGLGGLFIVLLKVFAPGVVSTSHEVTRAIEVLTGFSLGAESIALFARVGGGIYTKAADVGADLVGKVEAGIPEDDPRNPATIADNVGDNVGDVAGMGADLFGSYVGAVIATIAIASTSSLLTNAVDMARAISLPIVYSMAGLVASIVGILMMRVLSRGNPASALRTTTFIAAGLFLVLAYYITINMPLNMQRADGGAYSITGPFWAVLAG